MDVNKLAKQNGLLVRGDTYYFQARIPEDCRKEFSGKTIYRERLEARTLAEAKALVHQQQVLFDERITSARTGGYIPTEADIERYCAAWIQQCLEEDEEQRTERPEGLSDHDFRVNEESNDIAGAGWRRELARGDTRGIEWEMDDFLFGAFGVKLKSGTEAHRRTAYAFLKANVKLVEMLQARQRGDVVDTPKSPLTDAQSDSTAPPKLSAAVTYFLESYPDKSREMYRKYRGVLPVLVQIIGDRPVNTIKQKDIEDFCRLLCKLPPRWSAIARERKLDIHALAALKHPKTISPKTFEDTYLASLRPFLNASKRTFGDRGFPLNLTTEGIVYSGTMKAGRNKQRAMTADELERLMKALELFAKNARETHKFWLPMLALHSGARVNELCQINPQTDYGTEDDIPYLHITEDSEGHEGLRKSVKNATSQRTLPIHPDLIRAGFLKYLDAIKASGAKLLFPLWGTWRGRGSPAAEDWFKDFLASTGLRDDTPGKRVVGFHCLRSTFLRRANTLRVRDADILTGHVGETGVVVRGYQGELGVKQKMEILERITFDLEWPTNMGAP